VNKSRSETADVCIIVRLFVYDGGSSESDAVRKFGCAGATVALVKVCEVQNNFEAENHSPSSSVFCECGESCRQC